MISAIIQAQSSPSVHQPVEPADSAQAPSETASIVDGMDGDEPEVLSHLAVPVGCSNAEKDEWVAAMAHQSGRARHEMTIKQLAMVLKVCCSIDSSLGSGFLPRCAARGCNCQCLHE